MDRSSMWYQTSPHLNNSQIKSYSQISRSYCNGSLYRATMTFISYAFPAMLGYLLTAVLAVTPQTRPIRLALFPTIMACAFCAVFSLDMSVVDHDQRWRNSISTFLMIGIVTRTLDWTLAREPLVRHLRPVEASQSIVMDALDLAFTLRGHGWNWSRGVYIPHETRPTDRRGFTFHVLLSSISHSLFHAVLHLVLRTLSSKNIGADGVSIFDDTLPFHVQYLRACIISACAALRIYTFFQAFYDASTLVGILVLGQDPAQWPPAFDAPWCATSMCDFWGRRWHQFLRRTFLVLGGFPLSLLFGRVGLVFGAFLSSGVLHYGAMEMLDEKVQVRSVLFGFGEIGLVVLAEIILKRMTGCKVSGVLGWVWTMAWLAVLGNLIVDGYARAGTFQHLKFAEVIIPRRHVVERLVVNFDAWLHSM